LRSVSRYFEQRTLSDKGIHTMFSGKGDFSLATLALVLTSVKQLYDLHAFGFSAANRQVLFYVPLSLMAMLCMSLLVRWLRRKEDYQRGLLADAIALVTDREGNNRT
jgi:hypothetical protein